MPVRRSARRRLLLSAAAVLLGAGLAAPQLWAWSRLRDARSELVRYHPEAARADLAAALRVWPDRPSVRLLASRAARQAGDFDDADRQLRLGQRLAGGASEETAFEWALLQAAAGNVREVEDYLQRRAEQDPPATPLVWEALAEGYLRVYRTLDARALLDHWLALDPDNPRALELRGVTYVLGKGVQRGSEDLRRAVELDPARGQTRRRLVRALLDLGGYGEAVPHVEWLLRSAPGDPELTAQLARCYNMTGRGAEARRVLDEALERHPDHGLLLRTRGQLALADERWADAERWLRAAAAALPDDYQAQWLLSEALRQGGKAAEAAAQLKVAEQVRDRSERLSELRSRKLSEQPLDPALHYEMGLLLLRAGRGDVGERWLQSALSLDPGYKPAHAALADYYEQTGDKARAADHRRQAAE